jgi:hypothetical protein
MRNQLASRIYRVTAVTVGLVLLCLAALDWVAYTVFMVSLTWR